MQTLNETSRLFRGKELLLMGIGEGFTVQQQFEVSGASEIQ